MGPDGPADGHSDERHGLHTARSSRDESVERVNIMIGCVCGLWKLEAVYSKLISIFLRANA